MGKLWKQIWSDDRGFVVSSELVLIATILGIGILVGIATVRDQVLFELGDVAEGVSAAVQRYSFAGITGHTATMAGSQFLDVYDLCDQRPPLFQCDPDSCIAVDLDATVETP